MVWYPSLSRENRLCLGFPNHLARVLHYINGYTDWSTAAVVISHPETGQGTRSAGPLAVCAIHFSESGMHDPSTNLREAERY